VSPSYIVGAQDQLSITVYDEAELTGKYRVDNDGFFSFPLLDRLRAGGRSVADLQSEITALLANGFLRNPQVRVEVDQFKSRSVFVSGEVRAPGKITMSSSAMTLLEALAQAGSPTSGASNDITVTRRADGSGTTDGAPTVTLVSRRDLETGRAGHDLVLQDGDIIHVSPAQRFYIAGWVRNPGFYVLEPGMTVQQAIALSGGLTDRGSDRGLTATRLVNGKAVDVPVRLEDTVQSNDTLNVRQRFF
jgi:polysaccharide export outer membrane protein